ncbi:MAG: S8 family serine peptidase [Candidatus Kerfeldbacteria bacterium]|nr:S8 family serine peptidase [Candidatus Kerfeldbacteria bacterium]
MLRFISTPKHLIILLGLALVFFVLLGIKSDAAARTYNSLTDNSKLKPDRCDLAVSWSSGVISSYRCSERLSEGTAVLYFKSQPGVRAVGLVRRYKFTLIPNDPGYKSQQGYWEKIKAPEAWERPQNLSLRPVIAVLDSGVDIDNPDLKPNIWFNPWEVPKDGQDNDNNGYADDVYGWDFVQNVADPKPKFETDWNEVAMQHGTIVAGVAAAVGNNSGGVTGLAWSARIMPLRVLNSHGVGDTVTVARGINYAVDNHADIINLSFVGNLSDPVLEDAISRAYRAGVLVVAASGNEAAVGVDMNKIPQYPVCDDGPNGENQVIGVGAVDDRDVRAEFSNYGARCIDLSAPGVRIFSTQFVDDARPGFKEPYGGYWSGTSVAAPMVSGALALLKANFSTLSPSQLRDILIASGDVLDLVNPGLSRQLGRRLNLKAAFELASGARFPQKHPLLVAPQQGTLSEVSTYDISGEMVQKFLAYLPSFKQGLNIASGDVDGDGQPDIITAPRPGGGPHIRIFNQKGEIEFQFMAMNEKFRGGLSVASADFTGDGKAEIVIGPGKGSANLVRIYDGDGTLRYQFMPYEPSYLGGVNVAAGDVDGDGQPEVVTAPSGLARLPVRVFDKFGNKKAEFYPYPASFRGGVNLSIGDVDSDGRPDIVAAPGSGGGPQIRVFNYRGKVLLQFFAYAKNFRGGVNLAVGDVDGDGANEIISTPGASGGPHLRVFTAKGEVKSQFFVGAASFRGGLSLAVIR